MMKTTLTTVLACAGMNALAGMTHWAVPAMSDVQRLPDVEPKDGEKNGIVRIIAAKGEYEPGSFVAVSDADIGKQSVTLSAFKTADGKVFPAANLDLKFVKVWYQNKNGWFSYFGDTDYKLCPELLVNDEDLVRCDAKTKANYAKIWKVKSKSEKVKSEEVKSGEGEEGYTWRWINPPRQIDRRYDAWPFYNDSTFEPMKPNFRDAETLQPVAFSKGEHKQFLLTAHVTKEIAAGVYRGVVRIGAPVKGEKTASVRQQVGGGGGEGKTASVRQQVGGGGGEGKTASVRQQVGGGCGEEKTASVRQQDLGTVVPVEIKVLDFELPGPKGYLKPQLDYQVSSYNYYIWDIMLSHNGGDIKLAQRQYEAIMRDLAAHNQLIQQWCGAGPFCQGFKMHYEAAKKAGMCLKPMTVGWVDPTIGKTEAERTTNAVSLVRRLDRAYGHHDILASYGDEPSSQWQRQARAKYELYQRFGVKFRIAGNQQTYNPNGYLWDWFNCAAEPTDSTQVDLWNKTLDIPVAWYAQQHVGAENPALNRRMYGMAPWLTGYTAIDNYAHHLGSWNDDRTTYKPMCFTYGIYGGVVDTLAWEGFREGVDDVRYATLMCRLAREAQQRGDIEAKKAGGKALQYLAMFDKTGDDLNACRAEMIGYIERLSTVLAAKPIPLPDIRLAPFEQKLAAAQAALAKAKETKKQSEIRPAVLKIGKLYVAEERFEDAIRFYEAEKCYNEAMQVYNGDYFRQTAVHLAPELKEKFLLERVTKPDCPDLYRREAYVTLRENHPDVADTCADAFWGKNDRKARLEALKTFNWSYLKWCNDAWVGGRHKTVLWIWRTAAKIALEEKVVLANDARAVQWGMQNFCDAGDIEGLKLITDAMLATNRYGAAMNYRIRLAREMLPQAFATNEAVVAAMRAFDAKHSGTLEMQKRVDQICMVGSLANCLGNETIARGIADYRKALYKPQERKCYEVRYSETPIAGAGDWSALKLPSTRLDREFGGSMEFLVTDVATGNRGDVATGDKKKKAAPPEMQVAADENGLHIRFEIPDADARKMQLKLAGAGSFEAYLAPGENTPYVCFILTPGSRKIDTFNTTYDTEGERMLKRSDVELSAFNTLYYDDRVVCTLDLDWALYPGHLPKDGDTWDFEAARWGSAGGQCWNGMESIHGRSTWGAFKFKLTEKQRLAIVRRQVFAAWSRYKWENTAWRHEGCLKHWEDTETGDVKFHEAVIKPLLARFAPYDKLMTPDISDENLLKVYAEAYPTWVDIVHVVGRLRADYLNRRALPAQEKPVPETLPETRPDVTVRFPSGNYGHIAVRDGIAVVSSGWSREDGVGVFDMSGERIAFLARFAARGYSCANPVFFGSRCYVPNGFSATVIDVGDPKRPKLAGYLNPQFPKEGCKQLWVQDGALYFNAHDGVRKVGPDGFSSEKVDMKAPPREPGKKVTVDGKTYEIAESCLKTATDSCPFLYNLSTLAVADGTAYVLASGNRYGRLLPLDVSTPGLRRFGDPTPVVDVPQTNVFMTMGMQTGGSVTRVGDLFFVDDGICRRKPDGTFEKLRDRTRAVANSSVDGKRIALAQATRCRIIDFSNPKKITTRDVAPKTDKPLHITGCVLQGNDLYLAYTLVEKKGQDFIYVYPTKGYVAHVDLTHPEDADSTVVVDVCVALAKAGDCLYVTGRKGYFALIDATNPNALKLHGVRRDLLDDDGYKIKWLEGRLFLLNERRIAELDVCDPFAPQIKALYARGVGSCAPSYDDFTVESGRLYALAHGSVDVFALDDPARTRPVANDCGVRGVDAKAYEPVDAKIFEGHSPMANPPKGVAFQPGTYGNSFGAAVHDWVKLSDGRYAVAYGEAGLVVCNADGTFHAEPGRDPSGWSTVIATAVLARDGALYAQGHDGKAYRVMIKR